MICFSISPGGQSSSTSSSSSSLLTSLRTILSDSEDDPSRPYGRCSSPSGCHQFIKTQGCLIALLTSPRLVVLLSSLNRYAPASSLVTARVPYPVLLCIRFPRSIQTSLLQFKISPPTEKPFYLHHFLKVLLLLVNHDIVFSPRAFTGQAFSFLLSCRTNHGSGSTLFQKGGFSIIHSGRPLGQAESWN